MGDDVLRHLLAEQTKARADRLIGSVPPRPPRKFNWWGALALLALPFAIVGTVYGVSGLNTLLFG